MIVRRLGLLFVTLASLASVGCVDTYNARAHTQLTDLKASHLKMVDDVTAGDGHTFDTTAFGASASTVDLKMREAVEYGRSLGDGARTSNLEQVQGDLREDVGLIRTKNRLLTDVEAKTIKDETGKAYDAAIKGEMMRSGAPTAGK